MSALAHIDSLRFAKTGEQQQGEFHVDQLPRLTDILARDDVAVQYRLSGAVEAGRPVLKLHIQAKVWLTCQRCLEKYPEQLVLDSVLPIARNEAELARWEADDPMLDALVADPGLVVAALVEDEILLGLPMATHHADDACGAVSQA